MCHSSDANPEEALIKLELYQGFGTFDVGMGYPGALGQVPHVLAILLEKVRISLGIFKNLVRRLWVERGPLILGWQFESQACRLRSKAPDCRKIEQSFCIRLGGPGQSRQLWETRTHKGYREGLLRSLMESRNKRLQF